VLEDFTYDAIENVKNYSQMKSVQDEILWTLNDEDKPVLQNWLEEELQEVNMSLILVKV
jgi:hypothetical protein